MGPNSKKEITYASYVSYTHSLEMAIYGIFSMPVQCLFAWLECWDTRQVLFHWATPTSLCLCIECDHHINSDTEFYTCGNLSDFREFQIMDFALEMLTILWLLKLNLKVSQIEF